MVTAPGKAHKLYEARFRRSYRKEFDCYGKTSWHDKKDCQKETETSEKEKTETAKEVKLQINNKKDRIVPSRMEYEKQSTRRKMRTAE